jgi:hypothetical protein
MTYDTIHMGWGKVQAIATAQDQLIGVSFHSAYIALFAVDLKTVQAFVHGQIIHKSVRQWKPLNISMAP